MPPVAPHDPASLNTRHTGLSLPLPFPTPVAPPPPQPLQMELAVSTLEPHLQGLTTADGAPLRHVYASKGL